MFHFHWEEKKQTRKGKIRMKRNPMWAGKEVGRHNYYYCFAVSFLIFIFLKNGHTLHLPKIKSRLF